MSRSVVIARRAAAVAALAVLVLAGPDKHRDEADVQPAPHPPAPALPR